MALGRKNMERKNKSRSLLVYFGPFMIAPFLEYGLCDRVILDRYRQRPQQLGDGSVVVGVENGLGISDERAGPRSWCRSLGF